MKTILKNGPYTYYNLYDGPWNFNFTDFKSTSLSRKINWFHSLMVFKPLFRDSANKYHGAYWDLLYGALEQTGKTEISRNFQLENFGVQPIFSADCYTQERISFTCKEIHADKYVLSRGAMTIELDRTNEKELPIGRLLKPAEHFGVESKLKFFGKEPLKVGEEVEFFRHWMDYWVESRDLHKIKAFYEPVIDVLVEQLFKYEMDLDQSIVCDSYCWNSAMDKFGGYTFWEEGRIHQDTESLLFDINFEKGLKGRSSIELLKMMDAFLKVIQSRSFRDHFSEDKIQFLEVFIQSQMLSGWDKVQKENFMSKNIIDLRSGIYMGDYKNACVLLSPCKERTFFIPKTHLQLSCPDLGELTVGMTVFLNSRSKFFFIRKSYQEKMEADLHFHFQLIRDTLKSLGIPLNLGIVFKAIS